MSQVVVKGVSFNLNDERERRLYEHAKKQGKFAPYIKSLIELDYRGLIGGSRKEDHESTPGKIAQEEFDIEDAADCFDF